VATGERDFHVSARRARSAIPFVIAASALGRRFFLLAGGLPTGTPDSAKEHKNGTDGNSEKGAEDTEAMTSLDNGEHRGLNVFVRSSRQPTAPEWVKARKTR
jgi:hypothetical protein